MNELNYKMPFFFSPWISLEDYEKIFVKKTIPKSIRNRIERMKELKKILKEK